MPNIVNDILYRELEDGFRDMGSCLVLEFDKMTVGADTALRRKLREAGFRYKVVKNRVAAKALKAVAKVDLRHTLKGKCGFVFAPEERAIEAAKLLREELKAIKKEKPFRLIGGVIEGEAIVGNRAEFIADLPDRNTIRAQLASAIAGPGRMLATVINALPAGLARCVQAKLDKAGEGS
ncbi:MAG: 50S ribosomal protein L10 [Planctomycetota bacterium]